MDMLSLKNSQVAGLAGINLSHSQTEASYSIARLSSGDRLVRASDDVASMSVAVSLQRNVVALKGTLNNALQSSSYLSVADASLSQIEEMLQRMNAISVQASSGALTDAERGFLNLEFTNLMDEVDRTAESTKFNEIPVLQRAADMEYEGLTFGQEAGTSGDAVLSFTSNIGVGQAVLLNTTNFVEGVDFTRGATTIETVKNLADALNNSADERIGEATYTATGTRMIITHRSTGVASNNFYINEQLSTAAAHFQVEYGLQVSGGLRYTLDGGTDGSARMGAVAVSGNSATNLVTDQAITISERSYTIAPGNTNFVDGSTFGTDPGSGVSTVWTFRTTPDPSNQFEVQIGANAEESIRNLTSALNSYLEDPRISGTQVHSHGMRQIEFVRDGEVLYIRSRLNGPTEDHANPALGLDLAESGSGVLSAAVVRDLNNGIRNGGINADGVTNGAFFGHLSGITAAYKGANFVEASITVGEHTYTATIGNTLPAGNTVVNFSSDTGGGYFKMELAAGNGLGVGNATDAQAYAEQLDLALAGVTFYQEKSINFLNVPDSETSEMSLTYSVNSDRPVLVEDVKVTSAARTDNASIEFTINGETFKALNEIGREIGDHEIFEFASTSDDSRVMRFTTTDVSFDLTTDEGAATLEAKLKDMLISPEQLLDVPNSEIFNLTISDDQEFDIQLQIEYTNTTALFGAAAETINVLSEDAAAEASNTILSAIDKITERRAYVGSIQSRLDYVISYNTTAIQNQEHARAVLADTDISSESVKYALSQVRINASISLIAQTNTLRESLVEKLYQNL